MRVIIKSKRGQMHIPFGIIFSIILIVAFIVVAFYAINYFLKLKEQAVISLFKEDLQNKIEDIWQSNSNVQGIEFSGNLPERIEYMCFADLDKDASGANEEKLKEFKRYRGTMFFYPVKSARGIPAIDITNLNLEFITENENPYCIENENGKINLRLSKGIYEDSVKVLSEDDARNSIEDWTDSNGDSGMGDECNSDSDCTPATCCHPTECVPMSQRPDCAAVSCTANCEPGTLDCGYGSCKCVNGNCEAVIA